MRDRGRIDVMIETLRLVWHKNPDMRLGQLVQVCADYSMPGTYRPDIFNIEDDKMFQGMVDFDRRLRK